MIFNVSGGGGAALNFRVVGGTTAPTNPAENCIWVNTSTPITRWIFSATEPSPAESGMVWISTGTSSTVEFNALKKNNITVYPISAKQFVGGAWVEKTAKSYQSGAWVEWIRYLYKNGNEYTGITGGWIDEKQSPTDTASYYPVEKRNGSMYVKTVYMHPANFATANAIDLSGVKKIVIDTPVLNFTGSQFCNVTVSILLTRNVVDSYVTHEKVATSKNSIVVDVSGIQAGEYYVGISVGFDVEIEITEIRME